MERRNDLMSYRKKLSADARLIVALLRKQPQKKKDLCKSAGVHLSTFYRIKPLLEIKIIKETEEGYALWNFIELKKAIDDYLNKLKESDSSPPTVTIDQIASKLGVSPSLIEEEIYPIVAKYGMEIKNDNGEKVVRIKGFRYLS